MNRKRGFVSESILNFKKGLVASGVLALVALYVGSCDVIAGVVSVDDIVGAVPKMYLVLLGGLYTLRVLIAAAMFVMDRSGIACSLMCAATYIVGGVVANVVFTVCAERFAIYGYRFGCSYAGALFGVYVVASMVGSVGKGLDEDIPLKKLAEEDAKEAKEMVDDKFEGTL